MTRSVDAEAKRVDVPTGRHEFRSVEALIPYARNARVHSGKQLQKLKASILLFGFNAPILIGADGVVVAGHARLAAAKMAGLRSVPVIVLEHLDAAQRRAYLLADNRIADDAKWDDELLAQELAELADLGDFDLASTGFDITEIDELLKAPAVARRRGADPDAAPAAPARPVSQLGDLWLLDGHRVLCGDSTIAANVGRLLGGQVPHLMVTDPPYGVEYDPSWRERAGVGSAGAAKGKVLNDDRADWLEAWALFPGQVAYVWHGALHAATVERSLVAAGFEIRSQIVWIKSRHALGRGHYHWQHEPAWYGVREGLGDRWVEHFRFVPEHELAAYAVRDGETAEWNGSRRESTAWFIEHLKSDTGHGTQKPIECMARPMRNNSEPGDAVYDPFLGSGTTIIAAETERRRAFGLELNPAYADIIVRRWQGFTLGVARLEDGRTFDQVAAERQAVAA